MSVGLLPCAMFLLMLWTDQPPNHTEKKKSFDLAKHWQMTKWKDKIKTEKRMDTGEDYVLTTKWNKSCYQVTFLRHSSALQRGQLETTFPYFI